MLTPDELAVLLPELSGLKEPETAEEAAAQMAQISAAIERCQKTMQFLAFGKGDGEELDKYVIAFKQLLLMEEQLHRKWQELLLGEYKAREGKLRASWWRFWDGE